MDFRLVGSEIVDGALGVSVRYQLPNGATLKTWVRDRLEGMDWLILEQVDLLHRGAGYRQVEV